MLNRTVDFIQDSPALEGVLQFCSDEVGLTDIYSDIDLMVGYYDAECVKVADQQFFTKLGACHIEKRAWTSTALGLPFYFEDSMSADISSMPAPGLAIFYIQEQKQPIWGCK